MILFIEYRRELKKILSGKVVLILAFMWILASVGLSMFLRISTVDDWRSQLNKDINQSYSLLDDEEIKSDELMKSFIQDEINIANFRLKKNIPNTPSASEILVSVLTFLVYALTLFTFITGASVITSEHRQNTIMSLVTRPVSYGLTLLAKFLSMVSYTVLSYFYIVFVLFISLLLILKGHLYDSLLLSYDLNGHISMISYSQILIASIPIGLTILLTYASMSFMIAVLTRKSIFSLIICFVIYSWGSSLFNLVNIPYTISRFALPVCLDELIVNLGESSTASSNDLQSCVISCFVYICIFFFVSFTFYSRKPLPTS